MPLAMSRNAARQIWGGQPAVVQIEWSSCFFKANGVGSRECRYPRQRFGLVSGFADSDGFGHPAPSTYCNIPNRGQEDKAVTTYNTSDFRKGLKIQIDGVPYLMVEMNFRKPGKGNALYECKLKNLIRGTVVDRTYRAGQTLEAADVMEFPAQFLYRQQDNFVFMNTSTYEQYELTKEQMGDAWQYMKDGIECSLMVYNNNPLAV